MHIGLEAISSGAGLGASAGGMIVYYRGLTAALSERRDVEAVTVFVSPWSELRAAGAVGLSRIWICRGLPRNRLGRVAYEQGFLPIALKRSAAEVLLSTCNTRPLLARKPSVVVLQSLQFLTHPGAFSAPRRRYLATIVRTSVQTADAVIAVSHWARGEAIRLLDISPDKIAAVPHGFSPSFRVESGDQLRDAFRLPDGIPYVVMISTFYRFKNHARLIEGFARLVEKGLPHHLLLVGGDADVTARELMELARRLKVADRIQCLGAVPHDLVPPIVAGADAVAYPSLYETFGHPILEALALGKPLVTSSIGAMAELAGDAAILVDPNSSDSIADGLAAAIENIELRRQLSVAGPRRAAEFSWARSAAGTVAVLKYAIEAKSGGRRGLN